MPTHRLTLSLAQKLQRLLEGEILPSSVLPRWIASELQEEGLISVQSHGSRNAYRLLDGEGCRQHLEMHYTGGATLTRWMELHAVDKGELDRSLLVRELADSKSISLRTFRGFLVNTCEPITAQMGEVSFTLSPVVDTAIFIQNPESFHIPADVLVVGVENGDNFRYIRRQSYLFPHEKVLFVSRYPQSSDLRNWLMKIPNRYLHFGDFDLAGIHIYETEYYRYLGERATFFVPEDIEERLETGNADLYDKQYAKFYQMSVNDDRVRRLVELIHHYRKVYEQEGYLR